MCDFSGRIVAWIDRELPDKEAADVERHIRACTECRSRAAAYEDVSRGFVAYCDAASGAKKGRRLPYWVPVLSGAAAVAAVLLLMFLPASIQQIPVRPRVAEAPSTVVLQTTSASVKTVYRRHGVTPVKTSSANWALAEPAIQITIPADAMFPPGAVPQGVNFIADLSIAADGSVQGLRLQP